MESYTWSTLHSSIWFQNKCANFMWKTGHSDSLVMIISMCVTHIKLQFPLYCSVFYRCNCYFINIHTVSLVVYQYDYRLTVGYNFFREACGLRRAHSFEDLSNELPAVIIKRFRRLYGYGIYEILMRIILLSSDLVELISKAFNTGIFLKGTSEMRWLPLNTPEV